MAEEDLKESTKALLPTAIEGAHEDMPENVRDIIGLPDDTTVVSWTSYDPALQGSKWRDSSLLLDVPVMMALCGVYFCLGLMVDWAYFAMLFVILVLRAPSWIVQFSAAQHVVWVLTEKHLYIVSKKHDSFTSMPGCFVIGNSVLSVPLDNIMDCCVAESSAIYGIESPCKIVVNTISNGPLASRYVGVNLANSKGFAQLILNQRGLIAGLNSSELPAAQCLAA
jgi:hypothetical protein